MGQNAEGLATKEQGVASQQGFSVRAIANYFINRSMKDGTEITHMKIQKLSYIAHGWCLALLDRPLIRDSVEAWEYGPVYPGLYHELKAYGREPISEEICDLVVEDGKLILVPASIKRESEDADQENRIVALLDRVWEVYSLFSAIKLSAMTHEKGTPWYDMVSKYPELKQRSLPIPRDLIKRHYQELSESDEG